MDYNLTKLYEKVYDRKDYKPQPTLRDKYNIVKENAQLTVSKNDEIIINEPITDDFVKKVKRDINVNKQFEGRESGSFEAVVDGILQAKGWANGNSAYVADVLNPVMFIFKSYDLNITNETISKFKKLQVSPNTPFRTMLMSSGIKSWYNVLPEEFVNLFEVAEDAKDAFEKLYNIKFLVNTVSVGKGELISTIISDAKKGDVGDLDFPGFGEYEIKGTGARLGGDGYTLQTSKKLEEILSTKSADLGAKSLKVIKQKVLTSISNVVGKLRWAAHGVKISKSIEDTDNIEEIKNITDSIVFDPDPAKDQKLKQSVIKTIETSYNKVSKIKGKNMSFSTSIATFFMKDNNLSYDDVISGLVNTRNYKSVNIDDLVTGIKAIVTPNNFESFLDPTSTNIRPLIAAIHLACYRNDKLFNGIVFTNDDIKRFHPVIFSGESNLSNEIPKFFEMFSKGFVFNMSIDPTRTSLGITLNQ
jgi:hypothetical protein